MSSGSKQFYCHPHDVTLPWDQYRQHCDDHHNGLSVSVVPSFDPPEQQDIQAVPEPSEVPGQLRCPSCAGSGRWPTGVCEACKGTGLSKTIRERIESGIQELHNAIIQYARDEAFLESKRGDRRAASEEIMDASVMYRESEQRVNKAINEHKGLWKQLAQAGYATGQWRHPANGNEPSN